MTMIGILARRDRVEILTDSISYTHDARGVWHEPGAKVMHLPGIASAVVTQGTVVFRDMWHQVMRNMAESEDITNFDVFGGTAEMVLQGGTPREYVHDVTRWLGMDIEADDGIQAQFAAFHVGWSPSARRMVALAYDSASGLTRHMLDGLYIMPSPAGYRPGPIEVTRLAGSLSDEVRREWLDLAPWPEPDSVYAWRVLAVACRRTRALLPPTSGFKVLVGGDVHLHTLTRDGMTSELVHRFDDPAEFAQMVTGTLHPIGQIQPCPCGNGKTLVDCLLDKGAGEQPCDCGSGRTFGECCSVYATVRDTLAGDPLPVPA